MSDVNASSNNSGGENTGQTSTTAGESTSSSSSSVARGRPPKALNNFDWDSFYRHNPDVVLAPEHAFTQSSVPLACEFQVSQKLEVSSQENADFVHLATVVGIIGCRLQLRCDGCDNTNDMYELVDSDQIFPVGSYRLRGKMFAAPMRFRKDAAAYNSFCQSILKNAVAAPKSAFKTPPPTPPKNYFEVGMKLEAVDIKHPSNICPATIVAKERHTVTIHLDGWDSKNDYKCSFNSRNLFPVGWCKKNSHPLQLPGPKVDNRVASAPIVNGRIPSRQLTASPASSTSTMKSTSVGVVPSSNPQVRSETTSTSNVPMEVNVEGDTVVSSTTNLRNDPSPLPPTTVSTTVSQSSSFSSVPTPAPANSCQSNPGGKSSTATVTPTSAGKSSAFSTTSKHFSKQANDIAPNLLQTQPSPAKKQKLLPNGNVGVYNASLPSYPTKVQQNSNSVNRTSLPPGVSSGPSPNIANSSRNQSAIKLPFPKIGSSPSIGVPQTPPNQQLNNLKLKGSGPSTNQFFPQTNTSFSTPPPIQRPVAMGSKSHQLQKTTNGNLQSSSPTNNNLKPSSAGISKPKLPTMPRPSMGINVNTNQTKSRPPSQTNGGYPAQQRQQKVVYQSKGVDTGPSISTQAMRTSFSNAGTSPMKQQVNNPPPKNKLLNKSSSNSPRGSSVYLSPSTSVPPPAATVVGNSPVVMMNGNMAVGIGAGVVSKPDYLPPQQVLLMNGGGVRAPEIPIDQQNSGVPNKREVNERWTVEDVIVYLKTVIPEFEKYENQFRSHEIDGKAFLLLTIDAIVKFMNVKLGHSLKIYNLVERINKSE